MKRALLVMVAVVGLAAACNSLGYADSEEKDPKPKTALTNGVITDAETGLQFRKAHSLVGERDLITFTNELTLSPNGKFLLWLMRVIPLEGGEPFKLVDFEALRGVWSPDGKKIAFYSGGIWVIPVSPETGKPTGPAKKRDEGHYWHQSQVCWSPDSEKILFRKDSNLWTCSVRDGAMVRITGESAFRIRGARSPDGKVIAYRRADGSVWLLPVEGGPPRKIVDTKGRAQPKWSPDGKWIFYGEGGKLRFVRIADTLRVDLDLPEELGDYLSWSPDGKKLLFYRLSYDEMWTAKVVSAGGGSSFEPARGADYSAYWHQWSADSKLMVIFGERAGDWGAWVVPIAGDDPFPLKLNVSLEGELEQQSLSPDGTKLLFSVKKAGEEENGWVVPVSVREGTTTGPPMKVFGEPGAKDFRWSPDGTKLAVLCQDDLWIARADGGSAVQLTKTPERELRQQWSPDGTAIAWISYSPGEESVLFLKRLPEGEPKKLVETSRWLRYAWSPDGVRIAYSDYDDSESLLSVIAVSGTEPKKVVHTAQGRYPRYAWSPDGKELAVMADEKISAYSFPDGSARLIADLKDQPLRGSFGMRWSPDGRSLAFILAHRPGDPPDPRDLDTDRTRIYTVSAKGGEPTELAADDPAAKYLIRWSPDGKWISYDSYYFAKARSEGIIWEVEIDEFLKRALAETR